MFAFVGRVLVAAYVSLVTAALFYRPDSGPLWTLVVTLFWLALLLVLTTSRLARHVGRVRRFAQPAPQQRPVPQERPLFSKTIDWTIPIVPIVPRRRQQDPRVVRQDQPLFSDDSAWRVPHDLRKAEETPGLDVPGRVSPPVR